MNIIIAFNKKHSRLKRRIIAEWQNIEISAPDSMQLIESAMVSQSNIQIEYLNSGWRTILPIVWKETKRGDLLLVCYKDNGDIRTYRWDRVLSLLIPDTLAQPENETDNNTEQSGDPVEFKNYHSVDMGVVPQKSTWSTEIEDIGGLDKLLEISESEQGNDLPYDEALNMLSNDKIEHNQEDFMEIEEENNKKLND